MDGHIAPLAEICSLAQKYGASVFVDDCHSTGFLGATGRGTDEHCGVQGQVDIINTTLGKALGGATGVFCRQTMLEWERMSGRAGQHTRLACLQCVGLPATGDPEM